MKLIHKAGLVLALLTLLGLAASNPAQAQVTEFLNRTAFTAASSNLTTLNFANANPSGGVLSQYNTAAGLTLGGVNFVGTYYGSYTLNVITPDFYPTYQGWNGNPTVLSDGLGNGVNGDFSGVTTFLNVTLPTGITSVGTDIYTTFGQDNSSNNTVTRVNFALFSGASQIGAFKVSTYGNPTLAFAGFKSSVPITSMSIYTDAGRYCNLSGFTFGPNAAPVPESSTLVSTGLLLCLGLGGLVVTARRRKVQSAE